MKELFVDTITPPGHGLAISKANMIHNITVLFNDQEKANLLEITDSQSEMYFDIIPFYQFVVFYCYAKGAGWSLKAFRFNNIDHALDEYNKMPGWKVEDKNRLIEVFITTQNNSEYLAKLTIR